VGQGALKDGKVDMGVFNALTLVNGCVDPRFNESDVQRLLEKDDAAVGQVAKAIWELTSPDAETVKND
jgi:hypothetical protein